MEIRTSKIITTELKSLGYNNVIEKIGITGVVGILKNGDYQVDLDAIPLGVKVAKKILLYC